MRHFDLTPAELAVAKEPGTPNLGLIGLGVVGFLAIVGVGGYFAFAHVDSLKSRTQAAAEETAQINEQVAAVEAQVAEAGQEVGNSNRELADAATQMLLASYGERRDYVFALRELEGILDGTGGWYESIDVATVAERSPRTVTLSGYLPTEGAVASFTKRVEATESFEDAELTMISDVEGVLDESSTSFVTYWSFTITANLADPGTGGATDPALVGEGGGGGVTKVAITPDPVREPEKAEPAEPAEPVEPPNAFEAAAAAAAGGGS